MEQRLPPPPFGKRALLKCHKHTAFMCRPVAKPLDLHIPQLSAMMEDCLRVVKRQQKLRSSPSLLQVAIA